MYRSFALLPDSSSGRPRPRSSLVLILGNVGSSEHTQFIEVAARVDLFLSTIGLVSLFTGMREQPIKIDCTNRNEEINQMKS